MASSPDIALVDVDGDLDVRSVGRFRAQIDSLISRSCRRIIVDLEHSPYVDSAGIGLILSEAKRMRASGGVLSLENVSREVMRAMRLACLLDLIPASERGARDVPELPNGSNPRWTRTILVDPDRMGDARRRLSELLGTLPLTPDEVFDMTLAVGEAIGNAIDHTSAVGVCANVEAYNDRVVVEVTDRGSGFEAADYPDASDDPCDERGRGIKLMRLLADSVSILKRSSAVGTIVRLVKLLDES